MTRFENASFTQREKELGDTSEGVFEAWANKNGLPFVRVGFNRPPFKKFYKVNELLRLMPDYVVEGPKETVFVEVKGCGREGLKIKEQSITALDHWDEYNPVFIFAYNSSFKQYSFFPFDTLIKLCEDREVLKFPDGKEYVIIPNNDLTWNNL
jgi:hypothetical protein